MKIKMLRSSSLGFAGTIRNANHHAKALMPLLIKISTDIQNWGYEEWLQGHNTHVLVTKDGRKLVLRGIHYEGKYIGISAEASNNIRCAKGKGMHIADFLADEIEKCGHVLAAFAIPPIGSQDEDENKVEPAEDIT